MNVAVIALSKQPQIVLPARKWNGEKMKTREFGGCLAGFLSLASLYLIGGGARYRLAWLCLAALFGFASLINFGVFDPRAAGLRRAFCFVSYLATLGCVLAIVSYGRTSEHLCLALAGSAVGLMFISALAELKLEDSGGS